MTQSPLLSHVDHTIRSKKLFNKGDKIIVALSGGADSCALLDILSRLKELSPKLIATHINHKLRGNESDDDEEFAGLLAARYNITFESCQIDVAAMAAKYRLNLEDAGRRARYRYLEEIRKKHSAQAIALAHHADDQTETILMRLLRGAGMSGLSGMDYQNGLLIRPLLDATRHDIEQYLKLRGLEYRYDSSNSNLLFLRNRIRHQLLPLLTEYNPNISKRLNTTAAILADEDRVLNSIALSQLSAANALKNHDVLTISVKWLSEQPIAIRRRIIRIVLEQSTGNLEDFSFDHVEAILHIIGSSRPNSKVNLPQGVIVAREYDLVTFYNTDTPSKGSVDPANISAEGTYVLSNGSVLEVTVCNSLPVDYKQSVDTALIDLGKAPYPWDIRGFAPGDRITPLGMIGTKKVKKIFIDKKIPESQRKSIPIIYSGELPVWVCGVCLSDLVKVDSRTNHFVKVTYIGSTC